MNRARSSLVAACLIALSSATVPLAAAASRPNVVLFLVDDMGWMDSGVYGSKYYETPNMDALAKRGMLFTDAYAANPLCSPTRASILTGKHPARLRFTTAAGHTQPTPEDAQPYPDRVSPNSKLINPRTIRHLPLEEITVAEAFRDAGYVTGHFGKWHLGLNPEHWPDQQGFDIKFHGAPDPGPPSYHSPYKFKAGNVVDGPAGEYITERLTDEALKFVEANRNKPFLLHMWQYGVHGPWGHKEELTRHFANKKDPRGHQDNAIMASMLKSVDESLGRLVAKLAELKLTDQTIIIYSSDNGGNIHSNIESDRKRGANIKPDHPKYAQIADYREWAGFKPPTNNHPLRKGKAWLYEGGIRVPLIVVWPGKVEPESRNDTLVSSIDFYPTMIAMANVPKPAGQTFDGLSLLPLLTDKGSLKRDALFNFFPGGGPSRPGGITVRQGDWKLIRWYETSPEFPELLELYNLRDNLGETINLASQRPDKVKALRTLIGAFVKRTGASEPKPNPDYNPKFSQRKQAKAGAAADALQGWVPKSIRATPGADGLTLQADGRQPFIANTRRLNKVKQPGPYRFVVRFATNASGPGKLQWRTAEQEKFPQQGQIQDYEIKSGSKSLVVNVPVSGVIRHVRFYPPIADGPVTIQSIRLLPAGPENAKPLAIWNFKSPPDSRIK
jgi:arylsulfatase A-like enzyme